MRRVATVVAAMVAAMAVVGSLAVDASAQESPGPAGVTPAATNGSISYLDETGRVFLANADGTSPRLLLDTSTDSVRWAPDGSRFVYSSTLMNGLRTKRANGSDEVQLADGFGINAGTWTPDGSFVIYSHNGKLKLVSSDGGWARGDLIDPNHPWFDDWPTVAPDGTVVFERSASGSGGEQLFQLPPGARGATLLMPSGRRPVFSPDGSKLAYEVLDPNQSRPQVWVADADGTDPVQLTNENAGAVSPAWSPVGTEIIFQSGSGATIKRIDVASRIVTPVTQGFTPTWQPIERNAVDRVWGQDHVDTAIEASRYNYEDRVAPDPIRGAAGAVVLSRDDIYFDALVGSAFAVGRQAPLLITNRFGLDPRVEQEIRRVLGTSGTVFLLGGEQALAPAVANRLAALGYGVQRIWGQTHFDTALEIDRRITTTPHTAIVATGVNFFDALAAGAAAGANPGTVIVLTDGPSMPASSAAYLNGLNPDPQFGTAIVTAGGPGDQALANAFSGGQLPNWPDDAGRFPLVGANELDTALDIAEFFFAAPNTAAVATNRTWFDALTGGAMIGANAGPLLITAPDALYPDVRRYLNHNSGSVWSTVMLGGVFALPDALIAPIGDAISVPGQWDYFPSGQATATSQGTSQATRQRPAAGPGTDARPGAGRTPVKIGD